MWKEASGLDENVVVKVAVKELCQFIARSGSLDARSGVGRLVEGTRLHRILQSRGGPGYVKEVSLDGRLEVDGTLFELSGRADGVIDEDDGYTIDEIKTTTQPLAYVFEEDYPAYWSQLECYAWMFVTLHHLDEIRVRMTFCHVETEDVRYFYRDYTRGELVERVRKLLSAYRKWALLDLAHRRELTGSAAKLVFPFEDTREGQDELVKASFRAFLRKSRLYAEAPTGIGKTISALYPAFRALGAGKGKRVFYLTAKTITRTAAANAFDKLRTAGLRAKSIVLTAKEKICFCREAVRDCSCLLCPYSDGHFSRVNDCLYSLVSNNETITRRLIEYYAKEYRVCPYELSLDAAEWCDLIICDYNYLFDPRVYLRRFFSEDAPKDDNLLLIDEAHNLAERARAMYSAELTFSRLLPLFKKLRTDDSILYAPMRGLLKQLLALKKGVELTDGIGFSVRKEAPDTLEAAAELFVSCGFDWLRVNGGDGGAPFAREMTDAVFDVMRFAKALSFADGRFVFFTEVRGEEIAARLICLDPAKVINDRLARARGAVLFSATLLPLDYYVDLLGGPLGADTGTSEYETLELASPFPRENLFLAAMDRVSTRFSDRERAAEEIAEILETVVPAKTGHYMAYFPSYRMLRDVLYAFRQVDEYTHCLVQKPGMTESDKEAFLSVFEKPDDGRGLLGFAVLGGMFSEGIDLAGEKLIGSIVVGVGLAQLNSESNLIAEHYNATRGSGYEYAYLYPGMNRVLQAAGRVIRTGTDRGVVLLIDDRFSTPAYVNLYPRHWNRMKLIGDAESLAASLERFWG